MFARFSITRCLYLYSYDACKGLSSVYVLWIYIYTTTNNIENTNFEENLFVSTTLFLLLENHILYKYWIHACVHFLSLMRFVLSIYITFDFWSIFWATEQEKPVRIYEHFPETISCAPTFPSLHIYLNNIFPFPKV